MRAAEVLHARLGQPEVAHLAGLDQLLDRGCDILDRDVRIDAVLVEQVDVVGAEPAQRVVDAPSDRHRPAVRPGRRSGRELEAELRGDDNLVAEGLERLADDLLVVERPVDLRGVEERDAAFDRCADQGDRTLPVRDRWEALAHSHTAEPERGDFEALAECALLQACSSWLSNDPGLVDVQLLQERDRVVE
jgi:hypothetical protein